MSPLSAITVSWGIFWGVISRAAQHRGMEISGDLIIPFGNVEFFNVERFARFAVDRVLSMKQPPTAVVVFESCGGKMSSAFVQGLDAKGVAVGSEISVVTTVRGALADTNIDVTIAGNDLFSVRFRHDGRRHVDGAFVRFDDGPQDDPVGFNMGGRERHWAPRRSGVRRVPGLWGSAQRTGRPLLRTEPVCCALDGPSRAPKGMRGIELASGGSKRWND